MKKISHAKEVEKKIREGILYRCGQLYIFFSLSFTLFSFYSYGFLKKNNLEITLFDNLWPRIFINIIPFLLIGMWLLKSKGSASLSKIVFSFIAFPLLTSLGALNHIWPQIASGHMDIFYAVNATNIYAVSIWFIYVGPPLAYALPLLGSFILLFFMPLLITLNIGGAGQDVISVFFNDALMSSAVNIYCSHIASKLRIRMVEEDLKSKNQTSRFLGKRVSEAIFENRPDLLDERQLEGLILSLDLRGFSRFVIGESKVTARSFIDQYHRIVSSSVDKYGGFIHKTAGDGHLISFGLMEDVDLSDLGLSSSEESESRLNRRKSLFNQMLNCFSNVSSELDILLKQMKKSEVLRLGGGADYGQITMKLMGTESSRQEYDFHGTSIIRATRLEAYTKTLFENLSMFKSVLAISPNVVSGFKNDEKIVCVNLKGKKIRDFDDLNEIYIFCEKSESLEVAS